MPRKLGLEPRVRGCLERDFFLLPSWSWRSKRREKDRSMKEAPAFLQTSDSTRYQI